METWLRSSAASVKDTAKDEIKDKNNIRSTGVLRPVPQDGQRQRPPPSPFFCLAREPAEAGEGTVSGTVRKQQANEQV